MRKHTFRPIGLMFGAVALLLSACSSGTGHAVPFASGTDLPQASCGSPPPVPEPALWLAYPLPGAVNVPASSAQLIVSGFPFFGFGGQAVILASAGGSVSLSDFSPAPSPLPSPYATPPAQGASYYDLTLPALAAHTTYSVSFTYTDWADDPPSCRTQVTHALGAFTTQ